MSTRTKPTMSLPLAALLLTGAMGTACWEPVPQMPATPSKGGTQDAAEQPLVNVVTPPMTTKELYAQEARLASEAKAARVAAAERKAAVERADVQRRQRAQKLFGEVMEPLAEAAEAYSEHDSLDESSWIGRDQEDNQEDINTLLDDAIAVLGVSDIATTRQMLRQLQNEILELQAGLVIDREVRLSAPAEEDLNKVQKTYTDSREDISLRIQEAEEGIVEREADIADLERDFVIQMRAIGVELTVDSARSLLSTVTGDDFIEMCVVFDNVRGGTVQLQELTEESGESLDAAKRYYGSYVVLIHMMDRIQLDLVRRINEDMLPRLKKFAQEAEVLIRDAEENMAEGGDRGIGEQNIASNSLTIRATEFYSSYLGQQAAEVMARNKALQVTLRDAQNTLDTVALSSEVAALMKEGSRNFAALLKLDLPDLKGFENAELKAEFERLTQKMNGVN